MTNENSVAFYYRSYTLNKADQYFTNINSILYKKALSKNVLLMFEIVLATYINYFSNGCWHLLTSIIVATPLISPCFQHYSNGHWHFWSYVGPRYSMLAPAHIFYEFLNAILNIQPIRCQVVWYKMLTWFETNDYFF